MNLSSLIRVFSTRSSAQGRGRHSGSSLEATCSAPVRCQRESGGELDQNVLLDRFGPKVNELSAKDLKYLAHISAVLDRTEIGHDVIYDIGASKGMWSTAFALYTQCEVYAFEPLPSMQADLARRKALCPSIHLQPVACGTENKETLIHQDCNKVEASSCLPMTDACTREFAASALGQSTDVPVREVRLDDWVKEKSLPFPGLVKIDVQGYENRVIEAAIGVLRRARYVWIELNLLPLYTGGSTFASVYKALNGLCYRLVDCFDLHRSRHDGRLLYMDGLFENRAPDECKD